MRKWIAAIAAVGVVAGCGGSTTAEPTKSPIISSPTTLASSFGGSEHQSVTVGRDVTTGQYRVERVESGLKLPAVDDGDDCPVVIRDSTGENLVSLFARWGQSLHLNSNGVRITTSSNCLWTKVD